MGRVIVEPNSQANSKEQDNGHKRVCQIYFNASKSANAWPAVDWKVQLERPQIRVTKTTISTMTVGRGATVLVLAVVLIVIMVTMFVACSGCLQPQVPSRCALPAGSARVCS